MRRIELTVLAMVLAVALVLGYSGRQAAAVASVDGKDLQQVRGFGNALVLYYKKYSFYPSLADMSAAETTTIKVARDKGNCPSLKLLMAGGYIEDARTFFSERCGAADEETLEAMQKELDPRKDKTWACSFAYDAGHSPNHEEVPVFGTPAVWLEKNEDSKAHVLTCVMIAKEMERDEKAKNFTFENYKSSKRDLIADNIYGDDREALGWRDSWLQLDVPMSLKKDAKKAEEKPVEKKAE